MTEREEYDMLKCIYKMAFNYYADHKPNISSEENRALEQLHSIIIAKRDKLYGTTSNNNSYSASNKITYNASNNNITRKETPQSQKVTYHYVSLYTPITQKIVHVDKPDDCNYDSIEGVLTTQGIRYVERFFSGMVKESYYYRTSFPIIVAKEGNTIRDVITKEEYVLINSWDRDYKKYMGNKIAVWLYLEVFSEEVFKLLRKLSSSDAALYAQKMSEVKAQIVRIYKEFLEERRRNLGPYANEDEYIRNFSKKN